MCIRDRSSTRVMGTCSLLGQAAGCAAAVAVKKGLTPRECAQKEIKTIQKTLLDAGVFLPHIRREPSALTRRAEFDLTAEEKETLLNGIERPRRDAEENSVSQKIGDSLRISFAQEEEISNLRLCFDPDFSRESISDNKKMRVFAMKLHTGKDFKPVRVANTLVKEFAVYADGREIARVENNFHRIVNLSLDVRAKVLEIKWLATNGAERIRLFSADVW